MALRDALAAGHLYCAFQPIVDLKKRQVFANEALVRSRSPDYKGPMEIIDAAIKEECMGELGRALRQMAVDNCPDTHLFLNLHPAEFDEGYLVRPDDGIFSHDRSIFLEITEGVPLSHFRHCHGVLREVRGRGIFLAVDDLGAGYSNLKYIADLAPEIVKLDRELISGLGGQRRLQRLVSSLVRLCEDMGARVIAEGIETAEELRAVLDSGVHFGQGYLLARPAFPVPAVDWSGLKAAEEMRPSEDRTTVEFARRGR